MMQRWRFMATILSRNHSVSFMPMASTLILSQV
jgi:hypothetical protein